MPLGDTCVGLLTLAALIGLLALAWVRSGDYLAAVLTPDRHTRLERLGYRGARREPGRSLRAPGAISWRCWRSRCASIVVLFVILVFQDRLPLSRELPGMGWSMALNTAVSFVTNTNWQSYAGESTLGYPAQMSGLAVQNFVSAAVGIAVAAALIRALMARRTDDVGNFWVDLVRINLRLLLPLSMIAAVVLMAGGVVQNLRRRELGRRRRPGADPARWSGGRPGGDQAAWAPTAAASSTPTPPIRTRTRLRGPTCSRPFCCWSSRSASPGPSRTMTGHRRQGPALLAVMVVLWAASVAATVWAEAGRYGLSAQAAGAAMEGKETQFGVWASRDLRGQHHGNLDRRGQRVARLDDPDGRRGAADQHAAR